MIPKFLCLHPSSILLRESSVVTCMRGFVGGTLAKKKGSNHDSSGRERVTDFLEELSHSQHSRTKLEEATAQRRRKSDAFLAFPSTGKDGPKIPFERVPIKELRGGHILDSQAQVYNQITVVRCSASHSGRD